jgi:hypothetical protein
MPRCRAAQLDQRSHKLIEEFCDRRTGAEVGSAFKVKNADLGLALSKMFFRRVDQRRQLCLFRGKQLNDLLPRQFILLFAQFSTEVLDVHLRNIHALVHDDLPPPEGT